MFLRALYAGLLDFFGGDSFYVRALGKGSPFAYVDFYTNIRKYKEIIYDIWNEN